MSPDVPSADLDPQRFALHRARVRDGVELAYVREGEGGIPLLLVHGWPETRRIWWRNIGPLAAAGFEVIVPDLRGFGDSGPAADGRYDLAAHARDLAGLVRDVLGHESCAASGGDLGGGVIIDLGLRFPGLVTRQVLFNCVLPLLPEAYATAGLGLEALGIGIRPDGTVETDRHLRTALPSVYAAGDVAGPYQFTHTASHQAWYAAIFTRAFESEAVLRSISMRNA